MNQRIFFKTLVCSFLLVGTLMSSADAASLDDASIRAMFAEDSAAMTDPAKTEALMKNELDENYTQHFDVTEVMNNGRPESHEENNNKADTIKNAIEGIKALKNAKYEDTIQSIKYSPDHSVATVTSRSLATGTMVGPGPTKGQDITAHIKDDQSCVDKITLKDGALKILQSTCTDKLIATE